MRSVLASIAAGLDDQITILAGLIAESGSFAAPGERRTLREQATSLHCEMVGALVLSRSVAQAAPALSNEILRQTSCGVSVAKRRSRRGSTTPMKIPDLLSESAARRLGPFGAHPTK
jgi:TetR/AcrR family transcriptional repressor of nem operon